MAYMSLLFFYYVKVTYGKTCKFAYIQGLYLMYVLNADNDNLE